MRHQCRCVLSLRCLHLCFVNVNTLGVTTLRVPTRLRVPLCARAVPRVHIQRRAVSRAARDARPAAIKTPLGNRCARRVQRCVFLCVLVLVSRHIDGFKGMHSVYSSDVNIRAVPLLLTLGVYAS